MRKTKYRIEEPCIVNKNEFYTERKMKFPAVNISIENWNPKEDLLTYVLFNPYIYNNNYHVYKDYFYNYKFVDSNGDIYRIVDKKLPPSKWREIFKFLPNVFKIELIFEKLNEKMDVEQLRDYILKQISNLPNQVEHEDWIKQIKKSKTIVEILSQEVDKETGNERNAST